MMDDIPLEIPPAEDADVEQLYALLTARFEYEALLLRAGRAAEPAARLFTALRGRQLDPPMKQ